MGQRHFKSNCCTNQEPNLQTEIDVAPQGKGNRQGAYNTIPSSKLREKYKGLVNDDHETYEDEALNSSRKAMNYRLANETARKANDDTDLGQIQKLEELAEVVDRAPILKLKVISSSSLQKGRVFTINAQGLADSERNAKDGVTYFGCKKKAKAVNKDLKQKDILNDIIIPAISDEIAKKHRGRHFKIEYNLTQSCYKIKDLGIGFGTFYRLDFPLV